MKCYACGRNLEPGGFVRARVVTGGSVHSSRRGDSVSNHFADEAFCVGCAPQPDQDAEGWSTAMWVVGILFWPLLFTHPAVRRWYREHPEGAAWTCTVLGGLMLIAAVTPAPTPASSPPPPLAMMVTIGVALIAGGLLLLRRARRRVEDSNLALGTARLPDGTVFSAAEARGGRLTAGELVAESGGTYEAADRKLSSLAAAGACQVLTTDEGVIVFHFPEFADPTSKKRAL